METEKEEVKVRNVHHGHNIRLARMLKNIKQEDLAEKVNTTQPNVSEHENAAVLDDELLQRYAKALDVSLEALKTMEDNASTVVFESNVVNNQDTAGANTHVGYTNDDNNVIFNPIDKLTELYERLLQEKDDKFAAMERRVQNLEKLLSEK